MTASPAEFEDRLRRVLDQRAGQLQVPPAVWHAPEQTHPPGESRQGQGLDEQTARAPTQGARRHRWLPFGPLAAAFSSVVVIGIAVLALTGIRRSPERPPASPAVAGRQQLIDILGVLRRPQTKADLNAKVLSALEGRGPLMALEGTPDLRLVRFATTTPWGEKLYLVPMKPPTPGQLASIAGRFQGSARLIGRPSSHRETLEAFGSQGGNVGGGTSMSIEAGTDWNTEGHGPGASTTTRLFIVVPDGVARVEFVLPRQPFPTLAGAPIYPHSLSVAVPVHDNVAAMQADRVCCTGAIPMVWYRADGTVIKRIGDFVAVDRVIPAPRSGPETPRSRAAERDPSTPNPVWVTPRTGGPHTTFVVHFRLLLNGAGYRYTLSGTRCQGRFRGAFGGGVRGQIWSESLAYPGQAWCPGPYRVSVSVNDLGPVGNLNHPARPFGFATFMVHR